MSKTADIRVLIVDDHPAIRFEADALFRSERPDVTLMDLRLPDASGADLIARLRADFPDAVFVVLTTYDGDEDIHRALKAGARGYLLKDASGPDLVSAVRAAHAGQMTLPTVVAQRLAQRPTRELSSRELEVLAMIVHGKSNKEIAAALGISDSTVKVHVASILNKLGVHDRTEAVTQALRRGIVRL
jgi:DNA-binding NarL/FixJ family response regulator